MSVKGGGDVPVRELSPSARSEAVGKLFAAHFGKIPDFFVRVPGRVNLIGEHIDYCGYGVCPMALEQDVLLAVSVEKDTNLRLRNADSNYPDYQCKLTEFAIGIGDGAPEWHQYFLCGIKGIFDVMRPKDDQLKGMNVVVSGTVPQSAGLSSSSALVSAAALATAQTHNFHMSKEEMANLCAECERYIGTQGGGMDQAIAFLATEGCAKLIEFSPLRSTDVALPEGAVFVIAHSLAKLNKAATADFNCRVVECRLAAQIIAKRQGLSSWASIRKLGEVQQMLGVDLSRMIAIVEETLHEHPYTKAEVIQELETTSAHLDETSLTPNTKHIENFKLRQRALHVFQEARRVDMFHGVCSQAAAAVDQTSLATLGQLMGESHASLRDLYECSHPELDRLVALSEELTWGARLTGAGWGGCIVALVPPENVRKYMEMLSESFYNASQEEISKVLFATAPQSGACIYFAK